MSSAELDALARGAHHLLAGKYFQLAAFVMLLYDHILTLPEEVDRIWKRRFSGATILFLLNRYITPLQFIIILDAFHDRRWTKHVCSKFVVFEGASTVVLVAIGQLIMILRVYALYHRSLNILIILMIMWGAQIITSAVGLHTGFMVELPPMLTGCILTGKSPLFPMVWVGPLVMDLTIFGLTLWRTRMYLLDSGKTPTIHIFIRDGSAYFLVIFMANLLNTLFFFLSGSDLKAIGASFSQLITAVMVSRIVLNMRCSSTWSCYDENMSWYDESMLSVMGSGNARRNLGTDPQPSFLTRTITDLDDDNIAENYVVNCDHQFAEDSSSGIIPMSSMSIRRKLDSVYTQ